MAYRVCQMVTLKVFDLVGDVPNDVVQRLRLLRSRILQLLNLQSCYPKRQGDEVLPI